MIFRDRLPALMTACTLAAVVLISGCAGGGGATGGSTVVTGGGGGGGGPSYVADPAPAATPTAPAGSASVAPSAVLQQVLSLTNAQRSLAGLPALTYNDQLGAAALAHSQDMEARGYFSHTGSDGSSPSDRVTATGYAWSTVGENIAQGYDSAQAVVDGWMNSPGHRANILSPDFTQIGVALVDDTWTQVFATPR